MSLLPIHFSRGVALYTQEQAKESQAFQVTNGLSCREAQRGRICCKPLQTSQSICSQSSHASVAVGKMSVNGSNSSMVPNEETSQLPNRYLSSLSSALVTRTAGLRILSVYIGVILGLYWG